MRSIHSIRLGITVMSATFLAALPGTVNADRHVACPSSAAQLASAEPILGEPRTPWGELHEAESVRTKDGGYALRYDLTGGDAPQLEKCLICRYRDQSSKAIKLPTTTKECTVTTKPAGGFNAAARRPYYEVVDIFCR